jgi:hydrogenase nickel incorporation protein HypA/HybF
MHEVGIAQKLVSVAEGAARQAGLRRIQRMGVELGADAGLAPDALGFAFEVVARGTLAEGAALAFSGPGAEAAMAGVEHAHDHADERRADVRLTWIEGD